MATSPYPHDRTSVKPLCCGPQEAASWLNAVAEMALDGDPDAIRWLPNVVDHFLAAMLVDYICDRWGED